LRLVADLLGAGAIATVWHGAPFPFFAAVPDPRNPWSDPAERRRLEAFVAPETAADMMTGRLNPYLPLGHEAQHYWFPRPSPIGQHLSILREFLAHYGCRLAVVFFPARNQVTDAYLQFDALYNPPPITSLTGAEYRRPAVDTVAACVALGIPWVDLTPALRDREASGLRCFWNHDNHPKAATYLAAGRIIREQLLPAP
jgi:hypothetical protein